MIEFSYESNSKSNFGLEWEVNLEENVFVDDNEIFEIFDMVENYDLHALFWVIDEEEICDEEEEKKSF